MGRAARSSSRALPHLPQYLKSTGFEKLHLRQTFSILAPHLPQNTDPSGLSNWHFGHFISGSPFIKSLHKLFQL
jgi:hypothetical protein